MREERTQPALLRRRHKVGNGYKPPMEIAGPPPPLIVASTPYLRLQYASPSSEIDVVLRCPRKEEERKESAIRRSGDNISLHAISEVRAPNPLGRGDGTRDCKTV